MSRYVIAMLSGSLLLIDAAAAQETVTRPDEIRYCLCAQQSVATLGHRMEMARARHQALVERLAALDRQLAESKARVDVADDAAVDAYRRLVEAREQAEGELYETVTPALQTAVARYNGAAESYNAFCTTQSADAQALARVKAALTCPDEP